MPVLDPAGSPILEPVTAPKGPSVFEDFIDIYYAPRQVFARRRSGEFFAALVAVTLLMVVLSVAFYSLLEPGYDRMADQAIAQARKNPGFNDAAASAIRSFTAFSVKYGAILFIPLFGFIGGLITWLVGRFFDAKLSYGQSMTVTTYSIFPLVLGSIVMAIMSFLVPQDSVVGIQSYMLSPARFFDPNTTNAGLVALLMRIDPFAIWSAFITGVGISEIGKVSLGKGLGAAFVIWLIGTLLQAGPAALR